MACIVTDSKNSFFFPTWTWQLWKLQGAIFWVFNIERMTLHNRHAKNIEIWFIQWVITLLDIPMKKVHVLLIGGCGGTLVLCPIDAGYLNFLHNLNLQADEIKSKSCLTWMMDSPASDGGTVSSFCSSVQYINRFKKKYIWGGFRILEKSWIGWHHCFHFGTKTQIPELHPRGRVTI